MNVSGHDADLALARRYDAGTVGPDEPRLAFELQVFISAHHVQHGNAFRDADDQRHFGVHGFHDGIRGERRRHKDYRSIRFGLIFGFLHGIEHRPAFMRGSALARRHAADHLRAIGRAALGMECAFASSNALHNQARRFVNENGHRFNFVWPQPQLFRRRLSCLRRP